MRRPTSLLVVLTALLAGLAGTLAVTSPADAATRRLLTYGRDQFGVSITRASQVDRRLPGAPADFRRFAKRRINWLININDCPGVVSALSIRRIRTDGFAIGSEFYCGGNAQIWKRVSGRWRPVLGTQDGWSCRDLRRWAIPSSLLGRENWCWNGSSVQVTYRHA